MTKEEILKKVAEKEEQDAYVERCLKVRVCPECGHDLTEKGIVRLICNSCGYIWDCSEDID